MICGYRPEYAGTIFERYQRHTSDMLNDEMPNLDSYAKKILYSQSETINALTFPGQDEDRQQWLKALREFGMTEEIIQKIMKDDWSDNRRDLSACEVIAYLLGPTYQTLESLNKKALHYLKSNPAVEAEVTTATQSVA